MDPIQEWWEERAAIMEFDGGMDRGDAEYAAYALTFRHAQRTGEPVPYKGYFYIHKLGDDERLEWSDEACSVEYISPKSRRPRPDRYARGQKRRPAASSGKEAKWKRVL